MARWMNGRLSEELKNEMVSPDGPDSWKAGNENAGILRHGASLPPNAGMSSTTPFILRSKPGFLHYKCSIQPLFLALIDHWS